MWMPNETFTHKYISTGDQAFTAMCAHKKNHSKYICVYIRTNRENHNIFSDVICMWISWVFESCAHSHSLSFDTIACIYRSRETLRIAQLKSEPISLMCAYIISKIFMCVFFLTYRNSDFVYNISEHECKSFCCVFNKKIKRRHCERNEELGDGNKLETKRVREKRT